MMAEWIRALKKRTKEEQRSCIRFLISEGVKPIQIHRRMKVQYGDACLSVQQVYEWSRKFQHGMTSVTNCQRPGQAHRVVTPESLEAIEGLIQENPRLTVNDIAALLDMSHGSAHHVIYDLLQYRKVSARWVPRQLTPELKRHIVACPELLQDFEAEDKNKSGAQPKQEVDAEKQEQASVAGGREKGGKEGDKN